MKASQIIEKLNKLIELHGDLTTTVHDAENDNWNIKKVKYSGKVYTSPNGTVKEVLEISI